MDTSLISGLPDRAVAKAASPRSSLAVLVLEPDAAARTLLVRCVADAGHACDGADSPEQARTLVSGRRYDLLIAPMSLNTVGQYTDAVRSLVGGKAEAGLIVIADRDNPQEMQAAYDMGALACLGRPVNPQELAFALRTAV